jgi:hypothetical protein
MENHGVFTLSDYAQGSGQRSCPILGDGHVVLPERRFWIVGLRPLERQGVLLEEWCVMERNIDSRNTARTLEFGAGTEIYHGAKTNPIGTLEVFACEPMQRPRSIDNAPSNNSSILRSVSAQVSAVESGLKDEMAVRLRHGSDRKRAVQRSFEGSCSLPTQSRQHYGAGGSFPSSQRGHVSQSMPSR